MEDQVLYRKYRPHEWEQVVGQEHIVSVLKNSIEQSNFSHAYLFTGSRGTGKTSVARIFARALGTHDEDIMEIDAASNRGIDDIRALRESVRVLPFSSQYKIYIIDEVHMLSKDAFNALLKTLEEPPRHVVFVLATTELDKVPETILSRCQVFTFRKPSEATLVGTIKSIAAKEGKTMDDDAAALVSYLGDGSFRDTYSILQKVFSATKDRHITRAITELVTGAPSLAVIRDLYAALITKDIDKLYTILAAAEREHTDIMLLAELLLSTMRLSLMYRYSPSLRTDIESNYSTQTVEVIREGAVNGKETISSSGILALLTATERIAYAAVPSLPLEIAFLEMTGSELK